MVLGEVLHAALAALSAHKLRTALSVLGVVIGVAAVVGIVSILQGATSQIGAQIAGLGMQVINVNIRPTLIEDLSVRRAFTIDISSRLAALTGVAQAVPLARTVGEIVLAGGNTVSVSIVGVTPEYAQIFNYVPTQGRFLHPLDEKRKVVALGAQLANDLYQGIEAIGTRLAITLAGREHTFWVVGVMEERGQIGFENLDNQIYIPLSTLQALTGLSYISAYVALAESEIHVKEAVSAIEGLLGQMVYGTAQQVATARQIPGGMAFPLTTFRLPTMGGMRIVRGGFSPYDVRAPAQIVQTFEETTATLTLVLGGIAAISLLVGGIGIMNIMLVSVVERTQEIGIRMAVGARPHDIWAQFLSEAVLICLLGGLLGLLIGWAAGWAGSQFGGWPFVFAPTPAGIAFGFSALVGLAFGFYPALRAARLDPVAALGRV